MKHPKTGKINSLPMSIKVKNEDLENILTDEETVSFQAMSDSRKCYDDGGLTRTILICEQVVGFIKSFKKKNVVIIIEGYAFFASGDITLIAENVGHLKASLAKEYWEFDTIQPNSIKAQIAGFGKATKEVVALVLKEQYGVDFDNEDVNDAYAMAEYSRLKYLKLLKKDKVS
jgi:Holliday junction resolvasome RuvABC endonuclease subunit